MLDAILEYISTGHVPTVFVEKEEENKRKSNSIMSFDKLDFPQRMNGSNLRIHSKVLDSFKVPFQYLPLPSCPVLKPIESKPSNETMPM